MRNQCVCIWVYTYRVRKKEWDGGWCLYNVKTCCTNCIELVQQNDTQLYTIVYNMLHQLYTIDATIWHTIVYNYTIVCHIVASIVYNYTSIVYNCVSYCCITIVCHIVASIVCHIVASIVYNWCNMSSEVHIIQVPSPISFFLTHSIHVHSYT